MADYFMGVYYILEYYADTVEKMVEVTRASEESVVKGFEMLESEGLVNIIRGEGKIKRVEVTDKGYELYYAGL